MGNRNLNQDVEEVTSTAGQGIDPSVSAPKKNKQKKSAAIAKPTSKTTQVLEEQALKSYQRLQKVDSSATTALTKEAVRKGQKQALTEAVATETGYLGMTADLKIASTKKRIAGSRAVANQSDETASVAIIEMLDEQDIEGDDDFLSELSVLEGSNPAQLLPSLP